MKNNKKTTFSFIEEAKIIHEDKYDYSLVNYLNNKTKIEIICPFHGIFLTTPKNHLNGYNCPKCTGSLKKDTDDFILKSKQKHGDKYDYSKSIYKNAHSKLIIICPIHGEFQTTGRNHYYKGYGCKKCGYSKPHNKHNLESFLNKCKTIHGNKYDYSKVDYISVNKKIKIICKKHGDFYQMAGIHLKGHGCKKCAESIGEMFINDFLSKHNFNFIHQKKFENCKNPKTNHKLAFDFYLPQFNTCIEYDGMQHFQPIKYWGGQEQLEKIQFRDNIKSQYCLNNNISLLRIQNNQNIEQCLNNYLFSSQTQSNSVNR